MPQPGEFWVADIDYTHGLATKRRPALVLWSDGPDRIVAAVTTSAPRSPTDVQLTHWELSGLREPSTVRLLRLDAFISERLVRRIGRLSPEDAARLNEAWANHMRLSL